MLAIDGPDIGLLSSQLLSKHSLCDNSLGIRILRKHKIKSNNSSSFRVGTKVYMKQ